MVENLQEVFWISTGINDKPEYISPSYRDIWGRDPERLFDNPETYLEAIHEDDREWVRQCRQTIIQGNYDIQFRIVRPDGEIRWIWDRARPIVNDEGEIYRIVGIAEDITALKKHEEELQHARGEIIGIPGGAIDHGQGVTQFR